MIRRARLILGSTDADRDAAFLRDEFGLAAAEDGARFIVPAAELEVIRADANDASGLCLEVDDVDAFAEQLTAKGVACSPVVALRGRRSVAVTLPSGGLLVVQQVAGSARE
ncbi:MAG: hypothetical protein H6835_18900 [Planctomycetes bacterium]|nr:hypothetical protein [Planctomycetota bacterium]